MDVAEPWALAALLVAGVVAGALNVVAGGGSFLTLPVLLYVGLPAADANGTNRLGILAQNLTGVWGFHRSGRIDWRWAWAVSVPATAGAGLGAWLALTMSDFAFKRLLAVAMLGMTLWTMASSRPRHTTQPADVVSPWHPGVVVAFFLIGVYGGLIQAGVGFAVLAVTSVAGMDLVKGNAVKLLAVLLLTALSLVVFAAGDAVWWLPGLALGLGNVLGALAGVRLAVNRGHEWIQRVVTVTIVVMALWLWFGS